MTDQQPCPGHVVECASCQGTGKADRTYTGLLKCDVCKGVGSVLLK